MQTPRKIPLSIDELEGAFEWLHDARQMEFDDLPVVSFLNRTTGEIYSPEDEEEAEDGFDDENLLQLPNDLFEGYDWDLLDQFVSSLGDHPKRDKLAHAIQGKGAFQRFKAIVFGDGDIELKHRWLWFETCAKRKRIVGWLQAENIEPQWDCDIFAPPPLPDKRADLLRAVSEFVEAASKLPGVLRIALIGSLATNKPIPKDVDLLVGVADDLPLDDLARLSRQLNGKTMATGDGCGADVFLHNPKGEYLGRICQWKKCEPGIRIACQAQNCGQRHYLYDDLQVIRLDSDLIQSPPLILWTNDA